MKHSTTMMTATSTGEDIKVNAITKTWNLGKLKTQVMSINHVGWEVPMKDRFLDYYTIVVLIYSQYGDEAPVLEEPT